MINFELHSKNHIEFINPINGLEVINIFDMSKISIYEKEIKELINNFNLEYTWDEMFTYEDVINRIENSNLLFLLFYNKNPIGYVFLKPLSDYDFYLYNLYVTKIIERPKKSPIWFVNKVISKLPTPLNKVTCYCEDWHSHAQNIFISNGFSVIN